MPQIIFDKYLLHKSMLICAAGACVNFLAVLFEIIALSLPYWLILPDLPTGDYHSMSEILLGVKMYTDGVVSYFLSTFYSGLFMFCGHTGDANIQSNHDFCISTEADVPAAPRAVTQFNALVGNWRDTTKALGVLATLLSVVSMIIAITAAVGKQKSERVHKISSLTWLVVNSLACLMTAGCTFYFIGEYQQDARKMFFHGGGAIVFSRRPYASFYLFVTAFVVHIIGVSLAVVATCMSYRKRKEVNRFVVNPADLYKINHYDDYIKAY